MADWTRPMGQSFEYHEVDPGTWRDSRRISTVEGASLVRDSSQATLGSATIDADGTFGEGYVRVYLVTEQDGATERHALGTYLVQTPTSSFDGRRASASMDAYTPLVELSETSPPLGYYVDAGENVMAACASLCARHMRGPVVAAVAPDALGAAFVADGDETWLGFVTALASSAGHSLSLDETGRLLFSPDADPSAMQPVWTYDEGNSSILYPEVELTRDLYGVPNVVEVVWSDEHDVYVARVSNDDPNSPTSTVSRGREIQHREENPDLPGTPTQAAVEGYARRRLRELSQVEYEVFYRHGYNGVRLGDCVRLDHPRAGLPGVRARVTYQSIECEEGCPVTERATFSERLWG